MGGFAIRATALRWLEATDDLRAVTFSLAQKRSEALLRLLEADGSPSRTDPPQAPPQPTEAQ